MKLLMCLKCEDIFNLSLEKDKTCSCGKTQGRYVDELNATYSGPAIPIGFNNRSFLGAARNQRIANETERNSNNRYRNGKEFVAFIIPERATSLKKLEE